MSHLARGRKVQPTAAERAWPGVQLALGLPMVVGGATVLGDVHASRLNFFGHAEDAGEAQRPEEEAGEARHPCDLD
eukprot:scaffold22191_cov128-Isochrysis_galbana.AAC.3